LLQMTKDADKNTKRVKTKAQQEEATKDCAVSGGIQPLHRHCATAGASIMTVASNDGRCRQEHKESQRRGTARRSHRRL
jgi:hypothetical protein